MALFGKKKAAKDKKKKSKLREWIDAGLFAVVAATIIRWLLLELYVIPTPSMESSLLVNDFLFVSKYHYGTRTPHTPLQVPFTHQKLGPMQSYLPWIQLPSVRLPGLRDVEQGDVVVFNYPPELEHPYDLRANYVKRCVGLPGDTIEVKERQVYINGEAMENPAEMQFSYAVTTRNNVAIRDQHFDDLGIRNPQFLGSGYVIHTSPERAAQLEAKNFVEAVELMSVPAGQQEGGLFPNFRDSYFFEGKKTEYGWNRDNMGPLAIPQEGWTIPINLETLSLYANTIVYHEGLEDAKVVDGKLLIDGQEVTSYTFTEDYYFMMGDNRHNSEDSRYWGFVPEKHVVGKASFIFFSLEEGGFLDLRWSRLFQGID